MEARPAGSGSRWIAAGAALAGLGVAAGAFGAHALEARLSADLIAVFETGVRYHLVHALALLALGLLGELRGRSRRLDAAGWLFAVGILVFAGSLYALALTGARWLGAVTSVGGVCFLAAWTLFFLGARDGAG